MDKLWSVEICERTSKKWLGRKRWRVAAGEHTIIDNLALREFAEQIVDNHNNMVETFKSIENKIAAQAEELQTLRLNAA